MSTRVFVPIVVWLLSIAGGFAYLAVHASAWGAPAVAPHEWPIAAAIARSPDRPTLVVVLHPECPCSRATVAELARLMARVGDRVDAHVLFVPPRGIARRPEASDLWKSVTAISHVEASVDDRGVTARSFGALTSGQVLLYDAAGKLRFAGGITPARGHEGDSDGRDELEASIRGAAGIAESAVFGCSLFGEKK